MESYSKVGVHKDKFTFGGKTPLPPKTNSNTFCVWTEAWCSVKLFLPCASRCSVWGKLGRQTEAGRQRWHQAGSRQWETGGTEAGTPTDGDSGDAAERNRWQLVHRSALQLVFLLLLLHCLPGTTNTHSTRVKSTNMTTCNMLSDSVIHLSIHLWSTRDTKKKCGTTLLLICRRLNLT